MNAPYMTRQAHHEGTIQVGVSVRGVDRVPVFILQSTVGTKRELVLGHVGSQQHGLAVCIIRAIFSKYGEKDWCWFP